MPLYLINALWIDANLAGKIARLLERQNRATCGFAGF